MVLSRADVIRMAQEAGLIIRAAPPTKATIECLERFVSIVAAHIIARQPPPSMVVSMSDVDRATLKAWLVNAPAMPLQPEPSDSTLERERAARIDAQVENEALKGRLAASGVEQRRAVREAVLAEREACAVLMASMRAKSRNHLFRSALTCAEGEIRARGAA